MYSPAVIRRGACGLRPFPPCDPVDAMTRNHNAPTFSILVVDDNRETADTLALFLRVHGHDARAAYNAEQAISLFRDWPADAAILDIVMQGMDGIELARRLRLMTTGPLLLIALTGLGSPDEIAPLAVSEFNHFFLKPVNPEALLGLLTECAGRPVTESA
jgi:CheY-like chemotaxis protein